MIAAAIQSKSPLQTSEKLSAKKRDKVLLYVPKEIYLSKYLAKEDNFKYEWIDGVIEKTHKTITNAQAHIVNNLTEFFYRISFEGEVKGSFQNQNNAHLSDRQIRIPDMCYFNQQQAVEAANGGHPIAEFMLEAVSPTDNMYSYAKKMVDYQKAGVKVIWLIFPNVEQVHVYTGKTMMVCQDDDVCSASPALPLFQISVKDIFKKPVIEI
jgi:Uma2 family endonuclease